VGRGRRRGAEYRGKRERERGVITEWL